VLVATEEAARGLDLPAVGLVVLLGLPPDADRYVHLAGRTGRAGREGCVLSVVDYKEKRRMPGFEGQLGLRFRPLGDDAGSWLPRAD
jgi:superfamily II DNA/RNA helicase